MRLHALEGIGIMYAVDDATISTMDERFLHLAMDSVVDRRVIEDYSSAGLVLTIMFLLSYCIAL